MTFVLTLPPHTPDADALRDEARALAGTIAELAHMPRARRAERFARVAGDLFALTARCEGADESEVARRLIDEDGFAAELAEALGRLTTRAPSAATAHQD